MNKTLLFVLSLSLPASAGTLSLPAFVTSAQQDTVNAVLAKAKRTPVSMRVTSFGSALDVTEPSLRLSLRGSHFNESFSFNGRAGDKDLFFSASPYVWQDPQQGYSFFGGGVNLSMHPSGFGFWISGTVGQRVLNFEIRRFGSGLTLDGLIGADLRVLGFGMDQTVSGTADLDTLDKASLAALGAVIGVASTIPAR